MRAIIGAITAIVTYVLLSISIWYSYPDSVTREPTQGLPVGIIVTIVAFLLAVLSVKLGRAFAIGAGTTLILVGLLANLAPPPASYGESVFEWSYMLLVGGRSFVAVAVGSAVLAVAFMQRQGSRLSRRSADIASVRGQRSE